MRTNISFEPNDFNTIALPQEQTSDFVDIAEASSLSQSAWRYIDNDENEEAESVIELIASSNNPTPSTPQVRKSGELKIVAKKLFTDVRPPLSLNKRSAFRSSILLVLFLLLFISVAELARSMPSNLVRGGQDVQRRPLQPPPQATNVVKARLTPASTALSATIPITSDLPVPWIAAGYKPIDAIEASVVAETFTQRYQTIDYRSSSTLNSARFILTAEEDIRFSATDQRNTGNFFNQIQQQQLIQIASVSNIRLIKAQRHQAKFFVWANVSYRLDKQQGGESSLTTRTLVQSVLLVSVPFNTPTGAPVMGGIGWLVCNFGEGSTLLSIPANP